MTPNLNHRTPPPAPHPLCAVYAPLLPLLRVDELDDAQAHAVREHLAGCAWCQSKLATHAIVGDALRRHFGSGSEYGDVFPTLTLEALMHTSTHDIHDGISAQGPNTASAEQHPPDLPDPPPPASRSLQRPRPSGRLTALAAVAAWLAVALRAGVLVALHTAQVGNHKNPQLTPPPTCCGGVREFPLPAHGRGPLGITVGPDGNLWFTEDIGNKIGRLTP